MSYADHPLCDRTVTIYRRQGDTVHRQVAEGCYYAYQDCLTEDETGLRRERRFLLILPGEVQTVFPGDRVFDGVGPAVTAEQWQDFIPVNVPGLSEAAYAQAWYWEGRIAHTEAGRK